MAHVGAAKVHPIARMILAIALAALLLTAAVSQAPAAPSKSRGAAIAIANAGTTGGLAITTHNPGARGAPGQWEAGPDGTRIDPFLDGGVYCTAGWHVVSVGHGERLSAYGRRVDLFSALAATAVSLELDGTILATRRTPVHRYLNPLDFPGDIFAFTTYALLPPGSLGVGEHRLVTTVERPARPPEVTNVVFAALDC